MLNLIANRYLNEVLNPVANVFDITDYVFPTLDVNGTQPKSWARVQQLYASHTASWPSASSITIDDTYGADSVAAMSYLTGITSSQGGYDGLAAYNKVRAMLVASGAVDQTPGKDFASSSPKWDITPR
jgi:hypothetical protein